MRLSMGSLFCAFEAFFTAKFRREINSCIRGIISTMFRREINSCIRGFFLPQSRTKEKNLVELGEITSCYLVVEFFFTAEFRKGKFTKSHKGTRLSTRAYIMNFPMGKEKRLFWMVF